MSQTATAAAAPLVLLSADRAWPEPVLRTLDTVFAFAWPWSIALFLPLALLVFPDGLLPGRVWRAVAGVTAAASVLFVLNVGTEPGQVVGRALRPWLVLDDHAALAPLWTVSEILQAAGARRGRRRPGRALPARRRAAAPPAALAGARAGAR